MLTSNPVSTDAEVTTNMQRTSREISNANLTPFKPGQSGNPAGRPKKELAITSLVKGILDQVDLKTGKTYALLIAEAMVKSALRDPQILRELLNRTEGKVTDTIDMRTEAVSILYELTRPKEDATKQVKKPTEDADN